MCAAGKASGAVRNLLQCTCPAAGPCSLEAEMPSCATGPLHSAEDMIPELFPGTDVTSATVTLEAPVRRSVSAQTSMPPSHSLALPRSADSLPDERPAFLPGPTQLCALPRCHLGALELGPAYAAHPATHSQPETITQVPPRLGVRVHVAARESLCLVTDFGDHSGVQMSIRNVSGDVAVTASHWYSRGRQGPGSVWDVGRHCVLGLAQRGRPSSSFAASLSYDTWTQGLALCLSFIPFISVDPMCAYGTVFLQMSRTTSAVSVPMVAPQHTLPHMLMIQRMASFLFLEGVYILKAVIYDEFSGTEKELGPYYVKINNEDVSVFMNSSSIHKDELLVFAGSHPDQKGTVVRHRFPPTSSYNVSFASLTHEGNSQAWPRMPVSYQMQPISVYTNGTVFATDTNISFEAITKERMPLKFEWHFGDEPPMRTTSSSVRRRLSRPGWYHVWVEVSSGAGWAASEPRRIRVQRRVVANRLVSAASALANTSVAFECRINFGTDVVYLWHFGDGTVALGDSSSSHIYRREGEFTVEVLAFNNVSTTSLRKQLFIVHKPCQPPPVKNMGPGKVQVWRSQPVRLGVTFESAVLCDISQGLSYTWRFMNSAGSPVPLPPAVTTHRQTITVPNYFLEPGNYTALAKVHVEGSTVHSTYSVGVEVRARAPVSVVSEGTHLFIPRSASSTVVLTGSQSYDPDNPRATLRYHWKCTVASSPGSPCFTAPSPHSLGTGAPTFSFAADTLSHSYDQFLVTLTVSSSGRNSSEAQVVLSTHLGALRFVHISWVNFKDIFVNWNEGLSLQAECEGCREMSNLSYFWDLFVVNATEKTSVEVPFCRTVGLLGLLGFGAISKLSESSPQLVESSRAHPYVTTTQPSWELLPRALGRPARSAAGTRPPGSTVMPWLPTSGDAAASGQAPWDRGSLGPSTPKRSWPPQSPSSSAPSDWETYYSNIQEAAPSTGRPPADWTNINLLGSGPSVHADESLQEGDNLLVPFLPTAGARPTLLVDWPKSLVSRAVFHSYTSSGITGQTVTIKPYSLSPGETYVLQTSIALKHRFLGKAQLYLTLSGAPRDVACQVQPHHGLEAHTVFSVFCTSGRPDFHYEFSYQIGNLSKHTLYHGRDTQYYFMLPAGEPLDNYKVLVSTEITDGEGSQVQPCAVAVTVLPRFHGNHCPGEDVYNSSLKNLSTLQLMGSYMEIRNYIAMVTRVLSRWAKEDTSPSCGQWSRIQDALISSVCRLAFTDQEEVTDSVHLLRDLLHFPNKLSLLSSALILKLARALLTPSTFLGRPVVDREPTLQLILLVSGVLEVCDYGKSKNADYIWEEGVKVISDLLLSCLPSNSGPRLHISAGHMELSTLLHHGLQGSVQSLGSVQVHLPGDLARQSPAGMEGQRPCYISQLMFFKKNPYPGAPAPGQVGGSVFLSLYDCSSRRPISRPRLTSPVTVQFGEAGGWDNRRNQTMFVLLRDRVNFHRFVGPSENPQECLQIRTEFSKPLTRAFPVMLLVRFSERPTPSDFLVKHIYSWEERSVHICVPAISLRDTSLGYLSLLDADYDRTPPNQYFAEAVNYTVHFQWLQCLFGDKREWRSGSFSPQPGSSPETVNCSYDRLTAFSVARRELNASLEMSDVSKFQRCPASLLPGISIVVFTILYALLVTKSRRVDHYEKKKTGYIFLQESTPPGHQLYAVVIDTGFRAPARFSAKVYIVLCGENGLSEPKELYCPEKSLFERNSRHTFVLSAPARLGPLQKIRLWHNSCGPSPAWYVSHVMVKELGVQQGHSWLFPAECWLAVGRQDGCVERELACLHQGLGFWKLLYSKFTEYLEDFHVWASAYSAPPCNGLPCTQRLTVAFALLCTHACLTALVTATRQEQLPWAASPSDVTAGSFWAGFLCALLASPGAQLLSLLFRLSKDASGPPRAEPHLPPQGALGDAAQGPDSCRRTAGAQKTYEVVKPRGNILSGSARPCPAPELEARRAVPGQRANRGMSDVCAVSSQAPCSGFEGLTALWWPRTLLPWLSFAAWAICGIVCVACGLGTGLLGYRFGPTWCAGWMYLLALSVLCCAFITQPLMIGLVALGFAWKRRADKHFFTESLREATKGLDAELEELPRTCTPLHSCCGVPLCASEVEKALAYRQHVRRLRWARPPTTAQLRVTREKMRREAWTQVMLRDIAMYTFILLLHLFLTYGQFSRDEQALNQAIRNEFTRGARSSSRGLQSVDEWWGWSLSTLLDSLYPRGSSTASSSGAQPGALGGNCYLVGTLLIKHLRVPPGSLCKLPSPFSAPVQDALPSCGPKVGGPGMPSVTDPVIQSLAPSGTWGCGSWEDCVLSLGSTRSEAHAALTRLRASRRVDQHTRAMSVHFALYNPATQLFSSVSLSSEVLPAGDLTFSSVVESVTVFHSDSARWYLRTLPELFFLGLNLIHVCFQLYGMAEKGAYNYWRKPRSWLELSIVGSGLAYSAASSHLIALAGQVTNQFQKGLFQGFMDLHLTASWNQRVRWLQGVLSFLLTLKIIYLLGIQKTPVSCSSTMRGSLSSILATGLVGILMLAAHCHLHSVSLFSWALPSGMFADSSLSLLFLFPGRHRRDTFLSLAKPDQHALAWYSGALLTVMATLWFGMLRGSHMTLAEKRTSSQRKSLMRLTDLTAFIWEKVLSCLGLGRPGLEEAEMVEHHNHSLDELAYLLDELLLKINGLSDCPRPPLLKQQSSDMVETGAQVGTSVGVSACQAAGD
ncbi:polycystic kidney disease protein 1-like 1 [Manis pentadactyla]|uniref:polycystic kidney disease protein 1-like 1 n=1 Tax=Manis pentadactyla TaxID=143292 RepID=UPI00255D12C6|nr:polycystic kidney disease protein 1-like 1 [Manis pentadactyla]